MRNKIFVLGAVLILALFSFLISLSPTASAATDACNNAEVTNFYVTPSTVNSYSQQFQIITSLRLYISSNGQKNYDCIPGNTTYAKRDFIAKVWYQEGLYSTPTSGQLLFTETFPGDALNTTQPNFSFTRTLTDLGLGSLGPGGLVQFLVQVFLSSSVSTSQLTQSAPDSLTYSPGTGANTFKLTVSKTGNGAVTSSPNGINCGSTCSASFNKGTAVTLSANPSTGATFTGWSGGGCTGTSTCSVTLNADTTVSATFTGGSSAGPTLTISKTGNGTVTSSPAGINCGSTCSGSFPKDSSVTLTATSATGGTFTGWSGGGCSGTGTCVVKLSADTTVTAAFSGGGGPSGNTGYSSGLGNQPLAETGFLTSTCGKGGTIAGCIKSIYLLALALGALIALLMIVLAGYRYITAQGNAQQVEGAKESFTAAFIGLIIIFVAFILLYTINPSLVSFGGLNLPAIPSSPNQSGNTGNPGTLSCTLNANPTTISAGQSTTLTWTSTNATSATLDSNDTGFTATSVLLNGSQSVKPSGSADYQLEVKNASDNQFCNTSVTVTGGGGPAQIAINGLQSSYQTGDLVMITFSIVPSGDYTWSLQGTPPPGVSFNPGGPSLIGSVSSAPAGDYALTIVATQQSQQTTKPFTIHVAGFGGL